MYLYNSLSKKIELFKPIKNKEVKMYVCGITPYDTTHLGHAFTYVFFDTLRRYLTFSGYKVIYAQNVTDIDDDILREAKKQNKNWKKLGEFWTKRYLLNMKQLNVLPPTHFVKATNALDKIIEFTSILLSRGIAYQKNGNVYFEVKKFPTYGSLSKVSREQMLKLAKERGGNPDDPLKKDPLDFVLWQKSKKNEPSWESPFGKGRPGWHIECSVMINQYLGKRIDIHGGGHDLIFPHHESEIAQSEAATGKIPFARYFLHSAMVRHKGEKMSKSLQNLVLVSDLLKTYSPNAIRWVLLSHHYRSSWEYKEEELQEGENSIQKVINENDDVTNEDTELMSRFNQAMNDDINTPLALSLLQKSKPSSSKREISKVLGFK